VWVYETRVNHGRLVARCGLAQSHNGRSLEIPQWMFDTSVCCQMRMVPSPIASVDALRDLKSLLASSSQPSAECVLQRQHHSLSDEGGADANLTEPAMGDATGAVSSCVERSALGTAATGSSAADGALAGANAERTLGANVGLRNDDGGAR
jgi:hypothetical protein